MNIGNSSHYISHETEPVEPAEYPPPPKKKKKKKKKTLQLSHINVITHSTLGVEEIQGTFLKKLLSSNAEYSRYCFHVV